VALFTFLGIFDLDRYFTHSNPTPIREELPVEVPDGPWEQEDGAPQSHPSPTAVADRVAPVSLADIAMTEDVVSQPIETAPPQAADDVARSGSVGPPWDHGSLTNPSTGRPLDPPQDSQDGAEPLIAEEASPYPYSLLLATFLSRSRAERALRIYAEQGLETYYVKVNLGRKGVRYRVFAGSFKDREEALTLVRAKNLQQVAPRKTSYACLIEQSSTEEVLDPKIESLRRLGHSPYVVNKDDGRYYLYVGAFYTEQGATSQLAELRSQRISSQVVER
jgi:cell division septation protein DedD